MKASACEYWKPPEIAFWFPSHGIVTSRFCAFVWLGDLSMENCPCFSVKKEPIVLVCAAPRISSAVFACRWSESAACADAAATTCAADWPPSFFALSALKARLASGTTPAATAVPESETASASEATTRAGLGRGIRLNIGIPPRSDARSIPHPAHQFLTDLLHVAPGPRIGEEIALRERVGRVDHHLRDAGDP